MQKDTVQEDDEAKRIGPGQEKDSKELIRGNLYQPLFRGKDPLKALWVGASLGKSETMLMLSRD